MVNRDEAYRIRQKQMHTRHRKRLVFLAMASGLVVVASLIYFTVGEIIFPAQTQGISSKISPQNDYPMPCLTTPVDLVDPGEIHIRVLNGTTKGGFARAVSNALALRDYSVLPPDNAPEHVQETYIYYGVNTIAHAYQLAREFYDPVLVLDDREDYLIDVVIGSKFDNLVPVESVAAVGSGVLISSPSNCVTPESITKPVAFAHTPQASTSQSNKTDSTLSNNNTVNSNTN
jgi:hypothetical protein